MTERLGAPQDEGPWDHIVVGAGAGGAVVAARLAEEGRRVLVLEAGDDPAGPADPHPDQTRPQRADHDVPAFHAFASEHPGFRWDVFVRHYADDAVQKADWRYRATHDGRHVDGILYPRASGLGGSTAHHAMITVQPNNADWNHIAALNDDPTWRASVMRRYFERIERCRYRAAPRRWLAKVFGINPTGHGWSGWLRTERPMPLRVLLDIPLRRALKRSARAAFAGMPRALERWHWAIRGALDPNDRRLLDAGGIGLRMAPMSTARCTRTGPRERLLAVAKAHPERLTIRRNAFVTTVTVEGTRATGVTYREGTRLYEAAAAPRGAPGPERHARAERDVILCGGAFNTPQLLMLSGIGDPDHLAEHGIALRHALPGVGRNLQDRYEVGVVSRMSAPWKALKGATYTTADRHYRLWRRWRLGNYTSNGSVFGLIVPSRADKTLADLFCFSLLADFRGYYPGYSQRIKKPGYMTWAILKAYTQNTAGAVRLRSPDPFAQPDIQFRYFEEGNDAAASDLDAVVAGIRMVRRIADALGDAVDAEETPGRNLYTNADLRRYVRENAWGHHACGTCAMAPAEQGGVVDSAFRVHGVDGLRVVDASIFPRIPGYFIATAIYMVAEKAADVILGRPAP